MSKEILFAVVVVLVAVVLFVMIYKIVNRFFKSKPKPKPVDPVKELQEKNLAAKRNFDSR